MIGNGNVMKMSDVGCPFCFRSSFVVVEIQGEADPRSVPYF